MSDRALRELERAWRESEDPHLWARWQRARVRRGEVPPAALPLIARVAAGLDEAALRAAAYLGHAHAQALADPEWIAELSAAEDLGLLSVVLGGADPDQPEAAEAWLQGLPRWVPEEWIRRLALRSLEARCAQLGAPPEWDDYCYRANESSLRANLATLRQHLAQGGQLSAGPLGLQDEACCELSDLVHASAAVSDVPLGSLLPWLPALELRNQDALWQPLCEELLGLREEAP